MRTNVVPLVTMLLIVSAFLLPPSLFAASVAWDPPTLVDAGGDIANSLSIDFDSSNRPHISYIDYSAGNILRYARFDGSEWQIESLYDVRAVGWSSKTSIRVDSTGHPHIVVSGGSGPDYAYKGDVYWHVEDIDNIHSSPSLRIGSDGVRHVAYWTHTGGSVEKSYRYAKRTGGVWTPETAVSIDTTQVGECSLALSSANEPAIAYRNQISSDMCLVYKSGGSWVYSTIDSGTDDTGRCNDIGFDSSNEMHIAYVDLSGHRVVHAYHAPSGWTRETVWSGVDAQKVDMDISPGGTIGIGFATDLTLYYCRKPTTTWLVNSTSYKGLELAFAFSGSGSPGFATAKNTTGFDTPFESDLYYTTYSGGSFVDQLADDGGQVPYLGIGGSKDGEWAIYGAGRFWGDMVTRTGHLPSNLVVAGGYGASYADIEPKLTSGLYATYYGGDPQGTWFAETTSAPTSAASWTHRLVYPSACTVGSNLAVDPLSGEPRLAYITDALNGDLHYAWRDGSGWHDWRLDVTGLGRYASLALNNLGYARIAYYNNFSGDLKFANQYGGAEFAWTTENVDTSGDVGMRCAVAVDALDEPHIAYQDYTNSDLKYAHKHDGSWSIQTLDTATAGWSIGIAVDSQRRPHIAYWGGVCLKYAWFTGTEWLHSTISANMSATDTLPVSVSGNRVTIYYGDSALGAVMRIRGWFDPTPPSVPLVEDAGEWTTSNSQLRASWSSEDPETGIAGYTYAIGTSPTPDGPYVVGWTPVGTDTEVTRTGLSLENGTIYYFYVKAWNKAGECSGAGVSDGIRAIKSVSRIADLKRVPAGLWGLLTGKIVSRDSTPYYFMLQEPDRSSGITVYATKGNMPSYQGILTGYTVMVVGPTGRVDDRVCILNPVMVRPLSYVGDPRPLCMPNERIGGGPFHYDAGPPEVGERGCAWSGGLNNIGLLVCTAGRVKSVVSDLKEAYFTVNDGSLRKGDLKVIAEPSWSLPRRGDYVRV